MTKHKIIHTKKLPGHLHEVSRIERKKHHPLLHHLHKVHKFSKETLFYMKEYGPKSHAMKTILKESFLILVFASAISSFGGFALERIKTLFITITPLIIMLPALNDMIGDYGSIISSRFATMLYKGKVKKDWEKNLEIKKLYIQIIIISLLISSASAIISLIISGFSNYEVTLLTAGKLMFIVWLDVAVLVTLLFVVSIFAGLHVFKNHEDPNNFLIPIATSVADFGNMILLAVFVTILF
ncbi:MAG: magnesium transporter [Nanoarchaeota archaeon]